MYAERIAGKYKKSLQPRITCYIRNVMQRTVHVTDVLIQAYPQSRTFILPHYFGKLHPCDKNVFQKIITLYIVSPYRSISIFYNQQSSINHIYFYEYICSIFITN